METLATNTHATNTTMTKSILIIDDSSTNNLLCKAMFEEHGYKVLLTENGKEAIKVTKDENPDLILLDIMMPDMDGYSVLRKIKSDLATKHIPVVMVSAKSDKSSIEKAFQLGAIDYVVKPIGTNKLYEKVNKLLKS